MLLFTVQKWLRCLAPKSIGVITSVSVLIALHHWLSLDIRSLMVICFKVILLGCSIEIIIQRSNAIVVLDAIALHGRIVLGMASSLDFETRYCLLNLAFFEPESAARAPRIASLTVHV